MPYDNTSRGYPLPHPDNIAVQDVTRIRNGMMLIDKDVSDLTQHCQIIDAQFNKTHLETFINLWSLKK